MPSRPGEEGRKKKKEKEMVVVHNGINPTSVQDNCGTKAKEH